MQPEGGPAGGAAERPTSQTVLEAGSEYRFEVDWESPVTIQLLRGRAEIAGQELIVKGTPATEYTASETMMNMYLTLHMAIEQQRERAELNTGPPPRIMIIGPSDAGKTTLCRILLNYAIKQSRFPTFVNLDPSQPSISLPGTIAATTLSRIVDYSESFDGTPVVTGQTPLVYFYGDTSIHEKPQLYRATVRSLAGALSRMSSENAHAGLVIDTPAKFMESAASESLMDAIHALDVNILVVMGQERLYSELKRKLAPNESTSKSSAAAARKAKGAAAPPASVTVLKMALSGATVTREATARQREADAAVRRYFYGTAANPLTPFTFTMNYKAMRVRLLGQGVQAPASAMPLGASVTEAEIEAIEMEPGAALLHSVLAVSYAPLPQLSKPAVDVKGEPVKVEAETGSADDDDQTDALERLEVKNLLESNVAGFVYVADVNAKMDRVRLLAPHSGSLPGKYMLMGSLQWVE
ncbi:hypothetical protein CXG81DRAFT_9008 [Caulochytrium protostelioides]|uniref:Polynucleotide 5'-hydroxyl-kinase GRC3 n=1 Tax=Caulochytrium protostelioides TaxID=1555241 RepID=A0A4P9XED9_9FUNG|nr:hypothetical protein CXG81DRAFT_9008 [Caulochytrium protostelioides]|eukprot:RKP03872.1 hypothetical protein CXG81DRAFT_9008 [Caulochytrium protostelioides]